MSLLGCRVWAWLLGSANDTYQHGVELHVSDGNTGLFCDGSKTL